MKRIRVLILLGALAMACVVPTVAKAWDGGGTTNSVYIEQYAHYTLPSLLQVGLQVRCYGGVDGLVSVQVDQYPPETPYMVTFGSGSQPVVCDGKTHSVGASIVGEGYDAGRAKATATLTALSGNVVKVRWITIVVV